MSLPSGTHIGPYEILAPIGSGGMGEVYRARDSRLGREVALKVLSPTLSKDPDRRERFEREARAAAALNHPNIVTIHSVEEIDGIPFLTLELVDGQTLADLIPAEGLPLDRVLTLGIALADGVGAAHQRGITHRDLKPANIMLTADGRVKVLDFGLAKVKEDEQMAMAAGMPTTALTGEGRIVGTVAYMSPEQAEGKAVDQRSDVFSLGIILYEMASGVRPFAGDTPMSTLSSIIKDTPKPVTEVRAGLPRDLAKIVNRCLAKDVEDRYQSAKDLRNDLRALKNDLTSGDLEPISGSGVRAPAATAPAVPARKWGMFAAIAAFVLVAAAAALWWNMDGSSGTAEERPFDSIKLSRLTTTGAAGLAAMSLDGRYVAHVAIREGLQSLWLRQIATTSNVEIVPPAGVRYVGLTFSPDGNHIYYATYAANSNLGNLYQMPILGGGARLILEDVDTSITFSPDGKEFAFIRGYPDAGKSAVIVASADGSNARELIVRTRPLQFTLQGIAWSPDGKRVAATGRNMQELRGQIVIVDVAAKTETVLPTPDWRQISRVAWLPDGTGVLANAQESAGESSNQIFLVSYPSGESRRLTNDLSSYSGLAVAPDGRSFVAIRNERRSTIWTMAMDGVSPASPITAEAAGDEGGQGIAWTPDGRIVYTTEAGGNPDIWIMNADGSRRVQLTTNAGLDMSPRVTGDGRYIVYLSDRDGARRAWRMALDGSGATRLTTEVVGRVRVNLSADGKWLYYDDVPGAPRKMPVEGGAVEPLLAPDVMARMPQPLPGGFHEAIPSPDGKWIAGHYPTPQGERIVVFPSAGGPLQLLDTVPITAHWTADSRGFVYVETRAGVSNLVRHTIGAPATTPVTRFTDEQIFNGAISPDYTRLAVVRGRLNSDVVLVSTVAK